MGQENHHTMTKLTILLASGASQVPVDPPPSLYLAVSGVALVTSLIVSLSIFFSGDPNALWRSVAKKNCGLCFLAAAAASVLFILLKDSSGPALAPEDFGVVVLGAGIVGLVSGIIWFYLLHIKIDRLGNFEDSIFSEDKRPKRRWEL